MLEMDAKSLEKAIKKFKIEEGLGEKPDKKIKGVIHTADNTTPIEGEISRAIECAKKDLMVWTLTKKNDGFDKEKFGKFKGELKKYFSSKEKSKKGFDNWHNKRCLEVQEKMEVYYYGVEYGKAQKLVNMTFKYLYCFAHNKGGTYEKYFEFCHMPLDSYVLEWIKREMKRKQNTNFKVTKVPPWSNLEHSKEVDKAYKEAGYYTYDDLVSYVRDLINNFENDENHLTPLRAEFVIWPYMRIKMAAEEFLKQLEKETKDSEAKEKDPKKASLEENLELISMNLETIK